VLNVELRLAIQTAVMHNGVAALLLLTLVGAVYRSHYSRVEKPKS
jgi:heme A synthase